MQPMKDSNPVYSIVAAISVAAATTWLLFWWKRQRNQSHRHHCRTTSLASAMQANRPLLVEFGNDTKCRQCHYVF